MSVKNNSSIYDQVNYQVPRWRIAVRLVAVLILIGLNYALIGSVLEPHLQKSTARFMTNILSFLVLLFFDLTMLIPSLLQASAVSVSPQGIVLSTLLWKTKLNWADIPWFSKPAPLSFAIIRSPRCIYLLAKRDFANFDELIRILASRLNSAPGGHNTQG